LGTPANFNGFRILAGTARHSGRGRQPNFAALNRGLHLYSFGWAAMTLGIGPHSSYFYHGIKVWGSNLKKLCCNDIQLQLIDNQNPLLLLLLLLLLKIKITTTTTTIIMGFGPASCLRCSDTVGWVAGRASGP